VDIHRDAVFRLRPPHHVNVCVKRTRPHDIGSDIAMGHRQPGPGIQGHMIIQCGGTVIGGLVLSYGSESLRCVAPASI